MSGDYTRFTFDPAKVFSGVHKQQGRVSLDADFNEFEEILDRRDRSEMYDTVGPRGRAGDDARRVQDRRRRGRQADDRHRADVRGRASSPSVSATCSDPAHDGRSTPPWATSWAAGPLLVRRPAVSLPDARSRRSRRRRTRSTSSTSTSGSAKSPRGRTSGLIDRRSAAPTRRRASRPPGRSRRFERGRRRLHQPAAGLARADRAVDGPDDGRASAVPRRPGPA